jgi:lysozyme
MTYSEAGLALTKSFEGCVLDAYQDQGGVWTIGYGHTNGVHAGMTITQAQADEWLAEDLAWTVAAVNRLVTVPLTQGQFDALVDFAYNVGTGAFAGSTLLRAVNKGNLELAAQQFTLWDHVNGVENAGLLRRREAEEALFRG